MTARTKATSPSIKPSHKGRLHKALGIPEGQPIPRARLEAAARSRDPHMREMATYALNSRGWKKGGKKK